MHENLSKVIQTKTSSNDSFSGRTTITEIYSANFIGEVESLHEMGYAAPYACLCNIYKIIDGTPCRIKTHSVYIKSYQELQDITKHTVYYILLLQHANDELGDILLDRVKMR